MRINNHRGVPQAEMAPSTWVAWHPCWGQCSQCQFGRSLWLHVSAHKDTVSVQQVSSQTAATAWMVKGGRMLTTPYQFICCIDDHYQYWISLHWHHSSTDHNKYRWINLRSVDCMWLLRSQPHDRSTTHPITSTTHHDGLIHTTKTCKQELPGKNINKPVCDLHMYICTSTPNKATY